MIEDNGKKWAIGVEEVFINEEAKCIEFLFSWYCIKNFT